MSCPFPLAATLSGRYLFRENYLVVKATQFAVPGEESVVRTTILDDTTAAKRTAQRWAREKEAKIGAGV